MYFFFYGARENPMDHEVGLEGTHITGPVRIDWQGGELPIYGNLRLFKSTFAGGVLRVQGGLVDYRLSRKGCLKWRIGYDLFSEIRYLLKTGQPTSYALVPTLELHIDLLRQLLIKANIAFVEVAPRPAGCDFIGCLTHDVDFFGIRRHKFDRTMAGFLYRSSVGSLFDLLRGHRSLAEAGRNWLALCSLPLVFAGLLPDFWHPFEDYARVEDRRRSTFFLVPFKGKPGVSPDGTVNGWRATPYGVSDVRQEVQAAADSGSELGVHGLDAWRDAAAGHEEMNQLTSLTGQKATGIRMHWLYFDGDSPKLLEQAGFNYDSTYGYNETIGYRAGTTQAFRPLGCSTLMELPMTIMDSALFSSGRLGLSPTEASKLSEHIVNNARRFGGTVVINWHERSLAPERLLGRFYRGLLEKTEEGKRVWFARAGEVVDWFRWRRSISFCELPATRTVQVRVAEPNSDGRGAIVRVYRPRGAGAEIVDVEINGTGPLEVKV